MEFYEVLYSYLSSYCELSVTVVAAVPVVGVFMISEPVKKLNLLVLAPINAFLMVFNLVDR